MQTTPAMPTFRLALGEPPRIAVMGVGTHGPGRFTWRLPDLWCIHAYSYAAELVLDGVLLRITPRSIGISPAGAELDYRFPSASTHVMAHFRPAAGPGRWIVPALQDVGERFDALDTALREATAWRDAEPRRADARLWDVLWSLATPAASAGHPLVARARGLIELRLGERLEVAALARELGCSHNHLTRLFRAELRTGVAGWIRARRAQRARHLLTDTTMPIAEIAAEVGIPDAHHFNKTIRRELGAAPRRIRGALNH